VPYSSPILEFLFLFSVLVIWGMILFNLILTWGGYVYRRKFFKNPVAMAAEADLPAISAMIPARNEAMVIEKTVRALLAMDYPKDKFEVIVISDHSNDGTTEIVERLGKEDARVRCLSWPARERGSGKPRALNEGLKLCRFPVIAIYDGDNNPRPESLRILASAMVANNLGSWDSTCSLRSASAQSSRCICCIVTRNWFTSSIIVGSPQCRYVFRHVLSERNRGIVAE